LDNLISVEKRTIAIPHIPIFGWVPVNETEFRLLKLKFRNRSKITLNKNAYKSEDFTKLSKLLVHYAKKNKRRKRDKLNKSKQQQYLQT